MFIFLKLSRLVASCDESDYLYMYCPTAKYILILYSPPSN